MTRTADMGEGSNPDDRVVNEAHDSPAPDIRIPVSSEMHNRVKKMRTASRVQATRIVRPFLEAVVDRYEETGQSPDVIVNEILAGAGIPPRVEMGVGGALPQKMVQMWGYIGLANDFEVTPVSDAWVTIPDTINLPSKDCYVLVGIGQSMTNPDGPSIPSGSHCLFCPNSSPPLREIVHLEWENGTKCSLKRFMGLDAETDEYRFKALNPEYGELRLKRGEVEVKGVLKIDWRPRPRH
jgi:hypothetical protein